MRVGYCVVKSQLKILRTYPNLADPQSANSLYPMP